MDPTYRKLAEEYARLVRLFFGSRLISICFFGSVARGDAAPESDIDVLVVAEGFPRDLGYRAREMQSIRERVRRGEAYHNLRKEGRNAFISEVLLTPEEVKTHPPILLDITHDGVIMYDKDGFLESVLEDIRRRLKELGGSRVKARKGHYWILKPDAEPHEVVEI